MPTLELRPLRGWLSDEQLEALDASSLLRDVRDEVERDILLEGINEVALEEFLERLAADAASLYLPCPPVEVFEFEGVRIGSARSLLVRLETLRDELELDVPVDERTRSLAAQRSLWKAMKEGARELLETGQVLVIEGWP
ncbi:MAG: hypothetical protein SFW67_24265 [Myxococcaceae bacterium]|nr:hypothetical protein [Myxococcaceae bacterium]